MGKEINQRRALPNLQGVTGTALRILGMVWLEIGVGDQTHEQWVPVVPNNYLDADLLLGTDLLHKAPFTWDGRNNLLSWGNVTYVINHIRRQKGKVERVTVIPPPVGQEKQPRRINLSSPVKIEPYCSQFIPIPIPESPGETLLVHPQPTIMGNSIPVLTKVDNYGNIYLPVNNNAKGTRKVKQGTLLGTFEKLSFETVSTGNFGVVYFRTW